MNPRSCRQSIQSFLLTAPQMQQIEHRLFGAGIPVAALMEKVSHKIVQWFLSHHSEAGKTKQQQIGILAGPGHNGGDALVVARELHHLGFSVRIFQPFKTCKPLTQQHADYAKHLGISFVDAAQDLAGCSAIIDGWFGFGLTRPITGELAEAIALINHQPVPVFSIDLPSGIHTDTGQVMGTAIRASHTACLGLWKRGFMQETALQYLGKCDLIDFDIPLADISAVLGEVPAVERLTDQKASLSLPLNRSPTTHKYKAGHLLLIAGSRQYAGAALLAGLGATASGVGMLTLAVPESVRLSLLPQLPGALLVGCPETEKGAIARLPKSLDLDQYDAIALGPGLTTAAPNLLTPVLNQSCPVLLDADGLNLLAQTNPIQQLQKREAPTLLTPHFGEFKRLFPDIAAQHSDTLPGKIALQAAQASSAIILLKGPRSAIAQTLSSSLPNLFFNSHSTPALARGGSGDVLTGLMGGLLSTATRTRDWQTNPDALIDAVLGSVWWHSKAAIRLSQQRTVLGVDPLTLATHLNEALQESIA